MFPTGTRLRVGNITNHRNRLLARLIHLSACFNARLEITSGRDNSCRIGPTPLGNIHPATLVVHAVLCVCVYYYTIHSPTVAPVRADHSRVQTAERCSKGKQNREETARLAGSAGPQLGFGSEKST